MLKQQQADGELMGVYGRVVALVVMVTVLGFVGFRYFNNLEELSSPKHAIAHQRLLNVLVTLKSQWLAQGRPTSMPLLWHEHHQDSELSGDNERVNISASGWPVPATADVEGCRQLWWQLLGRGVDDMMAVEYDGTQQVCRFVIDDYVSMSYQLSSGRVIYISH